VITCLSNPFLCKASAAEERARDKREKQSEYVSCVARREELHALHAQLKEKEEKVRFSFCRFIYIGALLTNAYDYSIDSA
jgi:hypothetical protein